MTEQVGQIYYDVTLDTGKLLVEVRVINEQLGKVAKEGDKLQANFNALALAAKLLAAGFAAVKASTLSDDLRLMAARVQVAAGSLESGVTAMARLIEISKATQTAVAGNVEVFTRLNQSLLQMGGTQNDTLRVTELLGKAIKVSGASAVEAKAAMLQFGQALGSGKLAGDELRSLMENAPYLMKQLADGIGRPVGELKKLGEQGKLTADVVVNALSKAAAKIEADFAKFPQTLAGAFQVATDAAERANEKLDALTGTSTALTGAAKGLGEVLDKLADQFGANNDEAGKLGRNQAIRGWADTTRTALSYVVDGLDITWQALSVFGRNVKFVFESVGAEIGGIGAQIGAVMRGDFAGAAAIGDAMKEDSVKRRADLDAADAKTLADRKLFGQQMRQAWEQGAGGGRGVVNPTAQPSKLKSTPDSDEGRKLAAKTAAAQAYYEGIVAENSIALAKIDADERKALADNTKRAAEDKGNQEIYAKARVEIQKKYARERAKLEEKTTQEVADLNIAITTDAEAKIELTRAEALRRAAAGEALGTMTHAEAERAKTLATFTAEHERAVLAERMVQTNAETQIAAVTDELTRIDLIRQESFRRADTAARLGAITFAQAEADKARAAIDAQNAIRQQVLSINPLAALEKEYSEKLRIVEFYEQQMAQAGVEGAEFVEAKRTELAVQYQAQRQALVEAEFVSQSAANAFLIGSLNSLTSTATGAITGLLSGTMSAAEAMRALGNVVLNEAVGALVQVGMQYLKNALIGQAADKAMMASKAANAALYATAVSAQVGVASSLAAANAFAATAAIPLVGPGLAPGAAAAAGAATAALGAGAIALAPVAGARQYGGNVAANSMYRVNETGQPEMYVGPGGKQYMMPTKSGSVVPADQVGGDIPWTVNIYNAPEGTTSNIDSSARTIEIAVGRAKAEIAGEIASNSGAVWNAMRSSGGARPSGL